MSWLTDLLGQALGNGRVTTNPNGSTTNVPAPTVGQSIGTGLGATLGALVPQNGSGTSSSNSSSNQTGQTVTSNQSLIDALTSAFSNNSGQSSSTTTPNLTPGLKSLMDSLTQKFSSFSSPNIANLEAAGLSKIAGNTELQKQSVEGNLASRGLASSPVAAMAANNVDNSHFAQVNDFQAGLPQMAQQLQLQSLLPAQNFLSSAPVGSTSTGVNTQTGTSGQSSSQSNQSNSIVNTIMNILANQNGTQSSTSGTSTGGAVMGGLGTLLAKLFGG